MTPQRIVLTRNRSDWYNPNGTYAAKPGRQINIRGRVFAVDPANTSPTVVVGLCTDPKADPIYLRPGEMVTLPAEVREVWVFNPIIAQRWFTIQAVGGAIFSKAIVTLLVGTEADLVAWKARANRTRPTPTANVIGYGNIGTPAIGPGSMAGIGIDFGVVCEGIEKVSIQVFPLTAAGVVQIIPAGFAATITPWRFDYLPIVGGTVVVDTTSYDLTDLDSGAYPNTTSATAAFATPYSDSNLICSQTQSVFDLEVGAGGFLMLTYSGLAGVGVTGLFAIARGG